MTARSHLPARVAVLLTVSLAVLLAGCGAQPAGPRPAGAAVTPTAVREAPEDVLDVLSPWNTPVGRSPVAPGSAAMLNQALAGRPVTTGVRIATADSPPVVSGGVPTVLRCRQVACGDGGPALTLDVPPDGRPDPLHDGWLTIVDPASGTADDLLRARREPDGSISYAFLSRWDLRGPGYSAPYVEGARGSGLPLLAGLVRTGELERGEVDHALAIALPGPATGTFVAPASATDGTGAPGAVPEGARLRLRADVTLPTAPRASRSATTLVRALQTYGAIVVGHAPVPTLYAEDGAPAPVALTGRELAGLHLDDFDVVDQADRHRYPYPAADQALGGPSATAGDPTPGAAVEAPARVLVGTLPDPVPGVVVVDGDLDGVAPFSTGPVGGGVSVETGTSGEIRAFERLCVGQVDVVASSSPIPPDVWARCRASGLDVVQLEVAADAVVVATSRATDVGTDCVSTDQLAQAFGRGSTVDAYADLRSGQDLGTDPARTTVPFVATAPAVGSPVSRFFAQRVLGDPDPVASDLRADLVTTRDDTGTLDRVAATRGATGLFGLGGYTSAQDLLRPLEVGVVDPATGRPDCVLPTPRTILSGSYPLARPLLLTVSTRSVRRPEVRALLRRDLTDARREAVARGLVSPPRAAVLRQLAWLDGAPLPSFASVDGGPVEEQPVAPATPTPTPTYDTRPAR